MASGRWRRVWLIFLLLGMALAVLALDQASKALVRASWGPGEGVVLIPAGGGILTLIHIQNAGAAFGLFPGGGLFFVAVAVVVVAAILYYQRRLAEDEITVRLALGLQLGGAVGNLVDRLRYGYVTDFIHVRFWSTFNLADSAIVVGIVLLIYQFWRGSATEGK